MANKKEQMKKQLMIACGHLSFTHMLLKDFVVIVVASAADVVAVVIVVADVLWRLILQLFK